MSAEHRDPTDGRLKYLGPVPTGDVDPRVVGAKAAGLLLLCDAGLPVPPGFVLSTDVCADYHARGGLDPDVVELVTQGVRHLEQEAGRGFGSGRRPLLVSVRSGAPVSMPGMLETVLDIGLCDRTLSGLLRATGDPVFVWDSYRRLVQSYAGVVEGCPSGPFESAVEEAVTRHRVPDVSELDVAALRDLVARLQDLYRSLAGHPFPQDPDRQLLGAVEAVLRSWNADRAVEYRRLEGLSDLAGTAVIVQAMVFGNVGVLSGSGVGFTRDPATGRNDLYVDFLLDVQGEDVVGGRRSAADPGTAVTAVPGLAGQLQLVRRTLEELFGDAQDFEFTVEDGKLWLLQTRTAKRSALAALQIACDLVAEGVIDHATALERLRGYDLDHVARVGLSPHLGTDPLGHATPASAGVASGRIALDAEAALGRARRREPVVLVRQHASTDDVAALSVSKGLLTASGTRTSHAAVVARQLGLVCLVGCDDLSIDLAGRTLRIGGRRLDEDDTITLDATTGSVYPGALELVEERPDDLLELVHAWQQERSRAVRQA